MIAAQALKELEAERTDPLPKLRVRRWPRPIGFVFFLWTLFEVSVLTALLGGFAMAFMWFFPSLARTVPILWSRWTCALAGVRVETHLEEPLPKESVIFVSNHQSAFDILCLFVGLGPRHPFVFVAKKSVFRYPFLGWFITLARYIPIDRANREKSIQSLEQAGEKIRQGTSVLMFPEGTRSSDGSILPFKKGAFVMAMKARVPLVPLAIEGSLKVSPKRRWYACPNTVRILIGPTYRMHDVGEDDRDGLITDIRGTIIRLHHRLGGLGGDETRAIAAAGLEGIAEGDRPGAIS